MIFAANLKGYSLTREDTYKIRQKYAIDRSYRKGKVAFLNDKSFNKVGQNSWRRTPLRNTADLIGMKRVCHHFHYFFNVSHIYDGSSVEMSSNQELEVILKRAVTKRIGQRQQKRKISRWRHVYL